METNQVARQQTLNQVLSNWKIPPKVTGGKRGVQRESDCAGFSPILEPVPEQFGEKHEMIVVYPDQRAAFCCVGSCIGKKLINTFICLPRRIVV